jgi:hypothetical protein
VVLHIVGQVEQLSGHGKNPGEMGWRSWSSGANLLGVTEKAHRGTPQIRH